MSPLSGRGGGGSAPRGRGGFGARGGGRGGFGGGGGYDSGPPEYVEGYYIKRIINPYNFKSLIPFFFKEMGSFLKNCEGDLVCKSTNEKVPYFNAPIFLENKSQIGKVDDIFGSITDRVRYSSFIRSSFISRKDARR